MSELKTVPCIWKSDDTSYNFSTIDWRTNLEPSRRGSSFPELVNPKD